MPRAFGRRAVRMQRPLDQGLQPRTFGAPAGSRVAGFEVTGAREQGPRPRSSAAILAACPGKGSFRKAEPIRRIARSA